MGKYSPDKLLDLASLFEEKAKRPIPNRILALAVLTQEQEGKALQFQTSTLGKRIIELIGQQPSLENWDAWLDLNRTVLNNLPLGHWEHYYPNYINSYVGRDNRGNSIEAMMSTTHLPPHENFIVQAHHLLKGTGSIPNLHVQVGFNAGYTSAIIPPPALAHDVWLIEALKQLASVGFSERDYPAISKFMEDNKQVFRQIRSWFDTTSPVYLGGGADGVAFDIGGDKILKVFRSRPAYIKTQRAIERLHKNPELAKTEAMVYDIGEFSPLDAKGYTVNLYFYVIEKMRPVQDLSSKDDIHDLYISTLDDLLLLFKEKWKHMRDKVKDPSKHAEVKREVEQMAKDEAERLKSLYKISINRIESELTNLSPDWLESFIEEIVMKHITYRTDLHMGNLGVTRYGKLRYFDPAYDQIGSEIL